MLNGKWLERSNNSSYTPASKTTETLKSQSIGGLSGEGLRANPESQQELYDRMRKAIDRVAMVYSPNLTFSGVLPARKHALDTMAINRLADVERFERGWLALIADAKAHSKVEREGKDAF